MINPNIDVEECRRLYETGHFPTDVLARLYCVSIEDIVYAIEYHGWIEGGDNRANMLMNKSVQREIVNAKVFSNGELQLPDVIGDDKLGVRDIVNRDTNMAAYEQLLGIDINRRILQKLKEKMGSVERVDIADLSVRSLKEVAETSKVSIEILRKIRQLDEHDGESSRDGSRGATGQGGIEGLLDRIENQRIAPDGSRDHVKDAQVRGVIADRIREVADGDENE